MRLSRLLSSPSMTKNSSFFRNILSSFLDVSSSHRSYVIFTRLVDAVCPVENTLTDRCGIRFKMAARSIAVAVVFPICRGVMTSTS